MRRVRSAPLAEPPPAERGVGPFVGDVLLRFRAADSTTHVRALAYQMMFVTISGFIGLVGLASVLDIEQLRGVAQELARSLAPGPSGRILQQTIQQGASHGAAAAAVGLSAATLAGALAMAQIERSANRIAGSNDDRPGVRRYATALALALTIGVLLVAGTLVAVGGEAIGSGFGWSGTAETIWSWARWPLGAALLVAGIALLLRWVPQERLGARRATLAGAAVALALWILFSAGLAVYFGMRSSASENPYGPLVAVIALLLWSMLTSLALHLGMATVCELSGKRRPAEGDVVHLPDVRGEREAPAELPSAP